MSYRLFFCGKRGVGATWETRNDAQVALGLEIEAHGLSENRKCVNVVYRFEGFEAEFGKKDMERDKGKVRGKSGRKS